VGPYIRSHAVQVTLNNGFARTEVDQVFGNDEERDFEAIYSFPVPKRASLSEVSIWIDGREVIGEVVEKERAREIYEEQVSQGQDAALAEKDDYRTFDIAVGRVRAGEDTRVRFVYYQPLEIDLNVGRYVYPLAEGGVDEERIAFWSVDDRVQGTFRFALELKSAFPVRDVRVPGQAAALIEPRPVAEGSVYQVVVDSEAGVRLDQDIVVYYRLADDVPARVELVPYREDPTSPGTFMVVVTPAADLQPIAEGTDWIFVLDVSGSMQGNKIATLADGVSRVLGKLDPSDRFRIVTFNDRAEDLTGGYVTASPAHVQHWIQQVSAIQANRGTALFEGLQAAYRGLDDDRTTGIILVTDGVANVGPTAHDAFLKLLAQHDLRLFTFLVGNSVNTPLLERLARDSGGFAMAISPQDDLGGRLMQAKARVLHECLHDVELRVNGARVRDLAPARLGNLYVGQQAVVFGRYLEPGEIEIELRAKVSGEDRRWNCRSVLPAVDTENPELERLWALASIEDVMEQIREHGETDDGRDAVAALGTEFSLVTDYTSMVVVDEGVYEEKGIQRTNNDRVQRERAAQQVRAQQPAPVQRRVDAQPDNSGGAFGGRSSPGLGTGPVGPLFLGLLALLRLRRASR
jgi:Ca-activated chloride channel family protein